VGEAAGAVARRVDLDGLLGFEVRLGPLSVDSLSLYHSWVDICAQIMNESEPTTARWICWPSLVSWLRHDTDPHLGDIRAYTTHSMIQSTQAHTYQPTWQDLSLRLPAFPPRHDPSCILLDPNLPDGHSLISFMDSDLAR
jgi:hypothetical protein